MKNKTKQLNKRKISGYSLYLAENLSLRANYLLKIGEAGEYKELQLRSAYMEQKPWGAIKWYKELKHTEELLEPQCGPAWELETPGTQVLENPKLFWGLYLQLGSIYKNLLLHHTVILQKKNHMILSLYAKSEFLKVKYSFMKKLLPN